MSPATALVESFDFELVTEDGEPLEDPVHLEQMNLCLESVRRLMAERERRDFYAGGNMFVYYSPQQAQAIAEEESRRRETGGPPSDKTFRGPDVFFVGGVPDPEREREAWVVWDEGNRFPDVILEITSKSTAHVDHGLKKQIYADTFQTPEYFLWDPKKERLEGHRLLGGGYQTLRPDARGYLWSREWEAWLGPWHGTYKGVTRTWLRLFDRDGSMVPTQEEVAERAEAGRQEALAEVARLEARLAELERR